MSLLHTRGRRPRLTWSSRARLTAATTAGRLAALGSRLAGRGSGASIRGQVMLTVDPSALAKLLAGRRIAAISGTNGKTTTTHFLAAAVRQGLGPDAARVVTNADGANLHHGIASALGEAPHADIAVLETDERVVADVIKLGRPEVLVLLNFSRDQLDRHHEIKALARAWRDALAEAGADGPTVVANAEEPLVVWAAQAAHKVVWIDTASTWSQDATLCPACGSLLERTNPTDDDAGHWACTACEMREPKAVIRVGGTTIIGRDGTKLVPHLQVPGAFNVGNAACALAAAEELGVPCDEAIAGMETVTSPAGRFATTSVAGVDVRLLLAKNPAGWAEALRLLQSDPVVLAIDAVAADGKDVSWLWDVDYEQLAGTTIVATGPRGADLAVRLHYADVEHVLIEDLASAVKWAGDRATAGQPIDVLATYTPFQKLRRMGGV